MYPSDSKAPTTNLYGLGRGGPKKNPTPVMFESASMNEGFSSYLTYLDCGRLLECAANVKWASLACCDGRRAVLFRRRRGGSAERESGNER